MAEHVAELLPYYVAACTAAPATSRRCAPRVLERARERVAGFLGARADDVVVFTRNTTDALNLLAGCVPGPGAAAGRRAPRQPAALARRAAPGAARRPPPSQQTLGDLRDALRRRPDRAARRDRGVQRHRRGAAAGRDRRAGARRRRPAWPSTPPSWRRTGASTSPRPGVDYLALSGHKLYAPFGAGVLVGRRDWLDAAAPYLAGGGAVTPGRPVPGRRHRLGPRPAAARGRHPERARRRRARRGLPGAAPVLDEAAPAHERALLERLATGSTRSRA